MERHIMSRPFKSLTQDQQNEVETLAAVLTIDQMADYFMMSRTAFKQLIKRDNDINVLYKRGKAKAIGTVAKGLLMRARDGDTASAIFYLKTQAGWKEKTDINLTSDDGSMTPATPSLDWLAEVMNKANE